MHERVKRVQKNRIKTSGDKQVQALLNVLNRDWRSEGDSSLGRDSLLLVEQLQALDKLLRSDPKLFKREKGEHTEIYQRINRLLSRFPVYLRVVNGFHYGLPNPRGWEATWFLASLPKQECRELKPFLAALGIAQSGRIGLLRNCQKCQKWLFARVPGQTFCSGKCRNQFHSFNEADKKRRADWAKNRYKSNKKQRTLEQRREP